MGGGLRGCKCLVFTSLTPPPFGAVFLLAVCFLFSSVDVLVFADSGDELMELT